MINNKYALFENCIPVKGAKRSVIIDFQRKHIHFLPNAIIDVLEEYANKRLLDLFDDFKESKKTLKQYIT